MDRRRYLIGDVLERSRSRGLVECEVRAKETANADDSERIGEDVVTRYLALLRKEVIRERNMSDTLIVMRKRLD